MAIDPNIPLAIQPPKITLPDPNSGITLANLAMQMRDRQQVMQMRQQQFDQQNALRDILSAPGSIDASGNVTPKARQQIMAADPSAGMALQKSALAAQDAQAKRDYLKSETYQKKVQVEKGVNEQAVVAYEEALKSGSPEPQARLIGQKTYTDAMKNAASSGLFSQDEMKNAFPQFDPQRARSQIMSVEQYQAQRNKEDALAEKTRHDKAVEEIQQGKPLDAKSVDYLAEQYRRTGVMPSLGMGRAGAQVRQQILSRAAALAAQGGGSADSDLALRADVKAGGAALSTLAKTRANVGSFEGTALKEADLATSLMDKGVGGSAPIFNRWIQAGRKASGDADVTSFNAALTSLKNEYARIMSSPGATGGTTSDAARNEADSLINSAMTKEQLKKTIEVMKKGMANRMAAINEEYEKTQKAIGGGGSSAPASSGAPKPDAGSAPVMTKEQWQAAPAGTAYRMQGDPSGQVWIKH